MFLRLAFKSLVNRRGSVVLTLMAMTVSVVVLFSVEHIRHQAKESFASSVSGVDLVVGARTGSLNLLLTSVFHIGSPSNSMAWSSYEDITSKPEINWAVPIMLGDSHRGHRVVGTTQDFFTFFSYGQKRSLKFSEGEAFKHTFEMVLGADIAKKFGYSLGQKLTLSHGIADTSFSQHEEHPFEVVGILEATGTPIDQTLHISLEGIEAIHADFSENTPSEHQHGHNSLEPEKISAMFLGLKSRITTFQIQQSINQYNAEPLLAILPGVVLTELWQMMGILENTLLLVALLVFFAALLGLSAMLLSSIRDRTREIQLLRAIGAPPFFILILIELEALLITLLSVILGAGLLTLCLNSMQGFLIARFGLHISANIFSTNTLLFSLGILTASITIAAIPSINAYSKAKSLQP